MKTTSILAALAAFTFTAVACGGAHDDTSLDTTRSKLAGEGGNAPTTSSPSDPGCGGASTPPSAPVGGPVSSSPTGDGGTDGYLCDRAKCPSVISAIAALCPDKSTAQWECFTSGATCVWKPVCPL